MGGFLLCGVMFTLVWLETLEREPLFGDRRLRKKL